MCDGHCIELECGKGERLISIFAHQDVVPATGNWNHDPFEPYYDEKEYRLYARATSDDKGPGISCLYGLKALKDNNVVEDLGIVYYKDGEKNE